MKKENKYNFSKDSSHIDYYFPKIEDLAKLAKEINETAQKNKINKPKFRREEISRRSPLRFGNE